METEPTGTQFQVTWNKWDIITDVTVISVIINTTCVTWIEIWWRKSLNDVISVNCHNVDMIILQWLVPGGPAGQWAPSCVGCRDEQSWGPHHVLASSHQCLHRAQPPRPRLTLNTREFNTRLFSSVHSFLRPTMCLSQSLLAPVATRPGPPDCREICTMTICTKFSTKL